MLKISLEAGLARVRESINAYAVTAKLRQSVGEVVYPILHTAADLGHVLPTRFLLSLGEDDAAKDMFGRVPSEAIEGIWTYHNASGTRLAVTAWHRRWHRSLSSGRRHPATNWRFEGYW